MSPYDAWLIALANKTKKDKLDLIKDYSEYFQKGLTVDQAIIERLIELESRLAEIERLFIALELNGYSYDFSRLRELLKEMFTR